MTEITKRVSNLIEETILAKDEMSEAREIVATFPSDGPCPDPSDVEKALDGSKTSRLSEIKKEIRFDELKLSLGNAKSSVQAFSNDWFDANIFRRLVALEKFAIEEEIDLSSPELQNIFYMCIGIGRMLEEKERRNRHFSDIKREMAQQKSRKTGGDNSKKADTDALIAYMHRVIEKERCSVLKAGEWAAEEGLGAQTGDFIIDGDANRNRYNYWKKKRQTN